MLRRHAYIAGSLLLSFSLTACGGSGAAVPSQPSTVSQIPASAYLSPSSSPSVVNSPEPSIAVASQVSTDAIVSQQPIHIAAGPTSVSGWLSVPTQFSSGYTVVTKDNVNLSKVYQAAPLGVYQSNRVGMTSFVQAGLKANASYEVRFHYAETYFTAVGKRVFSNAINGVAAEANYDIFRTAGGKDIAVADYFNRTADVSGKITVTWHASVNNAMVSGIEIVPLTTVATPTPVPTASTTTYSAAFVWCASAISEDGHKLVGAGSERELQPAELRHEIADLDSKPRHRICVSLHGLRFLWGEWQDRLLSKWDIRTMH
jgi:hypothetical protein